MNFDEFRNQLMEILNASSQLYPELKKNNGILLPPEPQYLPELAALLHVELPHDFINFYTECAGLSLPDVHNSYFIFPVPHIIDRIKDNAFPIFMDGDPLVRLIPFGKDIGGNVFAIVTRHENDVYYLQREFIGSSGTFCMYYADVVEPKRIAETFTEFLQAVLEDARSYLEERPNWKYLDFELYGPGS